MEENKTNHSHRDEYYDDEINIYDLFVKIWKWKYLIISIVAVSLLGTFIYVRSNIMSVIVDTSESYSVNARINIGRVAGVLLEQWLDIEYYFKSSEFLSEDPCFSSLGFKIFMRPYLPERYQNVKQIIGFRITYTSNSPDKSFTCVNKAIETFLKRHDKIYKKAVGELRENVKLLKGRIFIDPVFILDSYTYPTFIGSKSYKPKNPDSKSSSQIPVSGLKLKLAIAFVTSLFMGIFISFFLDFMITERNKRKESAE